jgi:hypothetical protein
MRVVAVPGRPPESDVGREGVKLALRVQNCLLKRPQVIGGLLAYLDVQTGEERPQLLAHVLLQGLRVHERRARTSPSLVAALRGRATVGADHGPATASDKLASARPAASKPREREGGGGSSAAWLALRGRPLRQRHKRVLCFQVDHRAVVTLAEIAPVREHPTHGCRRPCASRRVLH